MIKSEQEDENVEKVKKSNLARELINGLQNSINRNEKIMDLNKQM